MEEGRFFNGAKCAAFKGLVVYHEIQKMDESKCAFLNRKNALWACENYFTDETFACYFAMFNKFRADRMIIEVPKNDKDRSHMRSGRKGTQHRLIKLRFLMFFCVFLSC